MHAAQMVSLPLSVCEKSVATQENSNCSQHRTHFTTNSMFDDYNLETDNILSFLKASKESIFSILTEKACAHLYTYTNVY